MKKMAMAFGPAFLLGATLAAPGAAQVDRDPIATPRVEGTAIVWIPHVEYERIVLTVSGTGGKVFRQELEAGGSPSFSLFDAKGERRPDGDYAYELRTALAVPPDLQERIAQARVDEDEEALCQLERELPRGLAQPGSFAIVAGSFVLAGEPEKDIDDTASASGKSRIAGTAGAGGPRPVSGRAITNVTAADQVIPDDLIVQGSLCTGFDCVNNESFGFDTIRLKENNLRIKFDDTSSLAGFPANDWQLTANDSASGGASKLSIEDITGAKVPFTIRAGAATNSIFVDSTGRVGFRTATPVLDLHVNTGNTPALRLEQNSSGGFTAQTWDIAGNEANFFVRDVTGGSRLPFRIRPGAPTSSIDISADGDVGVGTASPDEKVHVFENANANTIVQVENPHTGTEAAGVMRVQSDTALTNFIAHGSGRTISRFGVTLGGWNEFLGVNGNGLIVGTSADDPLILGTNAQNRLHITATGNVGINNSSPAHPLHVGTNNTNGNGAHLTAGGVWTNGSSREFKENIHDLTAEEARATVLALQPVRYKYKIEPGEEYVGFIAEDVPDLVATQSRQHMSPMDVVAVLTKVVQDQQKTIEELSAKIERLEGKE